MNNTQRSTDGQRGITTADKTVAEIQLSELLEIEGIEHHAVYRPGEFCRLLRISHTTLRQLCDLAEPISKTKPNPRALESFLAGSHHRIRHTALVEWLARNHKTERRDLS